MSTQVPEQVSKPPVVCVFCASSPGKNPIHVEAARALAQSFHDAGIKLVYGGGTLGIMGELAKTLVALSGPASVHGVIPRALIAKEPGHNGAIEREQMMSKKPEKTVTAEELEEMKKHRHGTPTQLRESEYGQTTVVANMHERKMLMTRMVLDGGRGSGFVALAGGVGTAEELLEQITWNQLGIHPLPIVLVNIQGYWGGLLQWLKNSVEEGFVGEKQAKILVEVQDPKEVVAALHNYRVSEARYQLDWT